MNKVALPLDNFKCPITRQIYYKPMLAEDGFTYEELPVQLWLKNNKISPLTGRVISDKLIPNNTMRTMVCNLLESNSELKEDQYVPIYSHQQFRDECFHIVKNQKFTELLKYTLFNLSDLTFVRLLLEGCTDQKVLKHCIDNCADLERQDHENWRPIHYICRYSTPEMIKYTIDKGVNLECQDNDNWKPIHYICRYSTPEMIKYIIDKGVDLECETNRRQRPIHIICRHSTPEMIKYIIDKGIDLECRDDENWRPIHYICRQSTPEMIKYIIDKGVDLECEINEKWRPIHIICSQSTPEMIKYIIDKGVDLECQDDTNWRPIHIICRQSTPEMVKYIINKGVDLKCQTNCDYFPEDLLKLNKDIDDKQSQSLINIIKQKIRGKRRIKLNENNQRTKKRKLC